MNEIFIPFGQIWSLFRSRLKGAYNFGYDIIQGATQFNQIARDQEKLATVLASPAVMKVFALQCDMFSMGKVCVEDKNGQPIENDPFLDLIKSPNPFSKTQSQFLWDFMFWNMMGTGYCYVDSAVVDKKGNKMYFLNPAKIEWPLEFERKKDKLVFSDAEIKAIMKTEITYRYDDGTTFKFPFDRLVISFDLTNSVGNFFKGPSRLDALHKIISNSEHTLDSDNINIRYTSKFMVAGDRQTGATVKPGIADDEKKDIINKMDRPEQNVYPVNSKMAIHRFVEDLAKLQLSGKYLDQYFLIGNMFNIPRDVLEAFNSSTYENQEKARMAHVTYCLEPKGEQWMDGYEIHFGYNTEGKNINISWDHLPFVQVFAKEKAEAKKVTVEVLNSLLQLGVSIDQANEFLGTEFEIEEKPEAPAQENGQGQTEADQGGNTPDEESEGETS